MPAPAFELVDEGDHCYIPAGNSPTGARLEAPCVFRAPRPWYAKREQNDWIQPIGDDEYEERVVGGEGAPEGEEPDEIVDEVTYSAVNTSESSEPPTEQKEAAEVDEASEETADEGDEGEGLSDEKKSQVALSHLEANEPGIRSELPEDPPGEDAPALERLCYALLESDDYQYQRGVLSDVSERAASGDQETIARKLRAELYDRELAEE